jgi:hypothetical protein
MGIAQNLKATHIIGESVRRVDDRVRVVDDRVTEVIRGASIIFNHPQVITYCTIWSTQTEWK